MSESIQPVPSPERRAPVLLGLGVPALIALLALWQWWRVATDQAMGDVLPAAHRSTHAEWAGGLAWLPPLTLLLGVAAIGVFLLALWGLRRATRQALHSRARLLQAFDAGRCWLPVFLLVQTSLVFFGLIGLSSFEALRLVDAGDLGRGPLRAIGVLALCALALLWMWLLIVRDMLRLSLRRTQPEPIRIMGQALTRDAAPALWRYVERLAGQLATRPPDAVLVGLNEGFFVTEHPVALVSGKPVPPGRVLYLPLPYVAFMARDEVSAVIGHELAHFHGEDTEYSLRFAPVYRAAVDSILAITNEHDDNDGGWRELLSRPATRFGKWFLSEFDHAVQHWSRQRELAADAFGTRVAGRQAVASALLRISALHAVVEAALQHNREAPPGRHEGVLTLVRRWVAEHGPDDPATHLGERQAHPLDTHPPLAQRLQALGVAIDAHLLQRALDRNESGLLAELGLEAAPGNAAAP
ncbi:M48 family metallopeptidase [Luteimonas sp. e5]